MKRSYLAKLALVVALTSTLAACGPYSLDQNEKRTAETGGLRYSQAANLDFVSCSGQDSDRDGYVTCTAKDRKSQQMTQLVCSYRSEGCKSK